MEFRFAYDAGAIHAGRGCVDGLEAALERLGSERALVVTGRTVGETDAVMDPIRRGLGDRLAGEFAATTPAKRLATAIDGAERMAAQGIDAVVSVGGGSSLDVAKGMVVADADWRSREALTTEFAERGTLSISPEGLTPIVTVPTTLAGADLSTVAGISHDTSEGVVQGGLADERLMPAALFYDTDLFRTTPAGVLCASAMNGFDKGLEALYAADRSAVTDATAMRGLSLLREGLPAMGAGDRDEETMEAAVLGTLLVQYGLSQEDGSLLSLIHAYGHALSRPYPIQQGEAHAVIAPHALRVLFDAVDARRDLLAEALVDDPPADPDRQADAVVEAVTAVRNGLGLLSRLRDVEGLARGDIPEIAHATLDDGFMGNGPTGFDPSAEELAGALEAAW